MLSGAIEALYIFNSQTHDPILTHVYRGRPVSAKAILPLYLTRPAPRSSVCYFPNLNPPTTLFTVRHANLWLCVPASVDTEPLAVLEWLHRLVDALEDFLGAPLLAGKIESSYDVVAQVVAEMCDAGVIGTTEPNALREVVSVPGWMDKLLGGVGLPGSAPTPSASNPQLALRPVQTGPAIPWRRSNVKHTSNELYVDMVETLHVTLAPSGRPLSAIVHGSVLFNAKISGVPDLLLTLSVPGGAHALHQVIETPTFHPCVRLARWRERPGELSFVPPDGKFMLAGYQVNLLPSSDPASHTASALNLPARVEVATALGPTGADFEVRLILSSLASTSTTSSLSGVQSHSRNASSSGRGTPNFFASLSSSTTPAGPSLHDVAVTIPLPSAVRACTDLRSSRGEAAFHPSEGQVLWHLSAKDAASPGVATLRCTVVGPLSSADLDDPAAGTFDAANGEYVADDEVAYQAGNLGSPTKEAPNKNEGVAEREQRRRAANRGLMPRGAAVSFGVQGWLPSGVRVASLTLDARRSRGLGEGVRPVKGVKYLCVSRGGVEVRC